MQTSVAPAEQEDVRSNGRPGNTEHGDSRDGRDNVRVALGRNIRALRRERGLSTVQVARAIGVSPSLISQIERGLSAPSLDVLHSIAGYLGVPVGVLFAPDAETNVAPQPMIAQASPRAQVVRRGQRKTLGLPGSVTYELLSPDLKHAIELIWVEFAPGQEGPIYSHEGEEQMVVIRGQMHYWVAGDLFVLDAGDAITIDASQPHRAANLGKDPAVVVAAITPPSF
ncbi:MAG: cupin domain-containing protein [Chloroflexi bacterium]|nr:cupin domain-containing protein [Chloroflexota bacterium]